MPTPPHAVDGTDTANIGTRKRKPVHDPLNSEVECLAALAVNKKARLDQNNLGKLGVASNLARDIPVRGSSPAGVVGNDDNIGGTRQVHTNTHGWVLQPFDEYSDENGVTPYPESTPSTRGRDTTPPDSERCTGESGGEDEIGDAAKTEDAAETEEAELGDVSAVLFNANPILTF